jgi:MerR family Zn(II)-responsive transcriptional regulator of zntA
MQPELFTIGELAKRANVSTSLLRYYEKEQLLQPSGRTESGYRLYSPAAEQSLRFIRRAQRYGFSLNDIKLILGVGGQAAGTDADVMNIAEQRFLQIERRLTEMLVLRHELELFISDMADHVDRSAGRALGAHYSELVEQVCGHDSGSHKKSSLTNLIDRLECNLASDEWKQVLSDLRGYHMHIWRDEDHYSILFSSQDAAVKKALERIAAGEANCEAHEQPEVISSEDGQLFRARGPNAFLYAQLFLSLEAAEATPSGSV